jgi:hypothetical protein
VPHPISSIYFSEMTFGTAAAIKSPRLCSMSMSLDRHAIRRALFAYTRAPEYTPGAHKTVDVHALPCTSGRKTSTFSTFSFIICVSSEQ